MIETAIASYVLGVCVGAAITAWTFRRKIRKLENRISTVAGFNRCFPESQN